MSGAGGGDRTETRTVYCSLHRVGRVKRLLEGLLTLAKNLAVTRPACIFMIKYDFCVFFRRVTIVKMQFFQWGDLNRLAIPYR